MPPPDRTTPTTTPAGGQRRPRALRAIDPWGPTELDAENLADRIAQDLDDPTEVVAADFADRLDAEALTLGDSTDVVILTARAPSQPPPLPRAARTRRAAQADLAPAGALPAPPRRFASGTVDGEPPVPRAMGGYTITGELASGTMGVVFRAEHATSRQPVAIKAMHPQRQKRSTDVARFFAEAVATARIVHPNVVRYFDFGYDEAGAAYLVMELLDGEPLSCRLARERRLDVATAVDIAIQIGLALAAAHAQGVVHRDIKPDNVFLCRDPARPERPVVKLLDFGVAKVEDHRHGTMHTQEGDLLGTPCYMAPEQGLSASSSDARSDLYSVGCLLFEMLCGVVPFAGNLVETLLAHQTSVRPSARATRPEVPVALDALIDRMLARDPDDRPPSASEVVRALTLIDAHDGRSPVVPRRRTRGRAWPLLIALAVAIGIAAGALLAQ